MATVASMITSRNTAGAAYATALANLKQAWQDVRKYDIALDNLNVRKTGAGAGTAVPLPLPTFGNPSGWGGAAYCLMHPNFSGFEEVSSWEQSAQAAAVTLINTAT
jgi:hypothetical protein